MSKAERNTRRQRRKWNHGGVITNQEFTRYNLNNTSISKDEVLYNIFGYHKKPDNDLYIAKYNRQDIAKRIINCYPEATWSSKPRVVQEDDFKLRTDLERGWEKFVYRTNIYEILTRLDKLACLGTYAILLIGVKDNRAMHRPIGKISSLDDLLYLRPKGTQHVKIERFDDRPNSVRYGLPLMYRVSMADRNDVDGGGFTPYKDILVHHSRVIHVKQGNLESEVYGRPMLEAVLNRLSDLDKVIGGGAQIFWNNGRGVLQLSLSTDPDIDFEDDGTLEAHATAFLNGETGMLKTRGVDVKTLGMTVSDPTGHVATILDMISGATGIPKRILTGSERGKLASSQDEKSWWSRVLERSETYAEPNILRPLVNKLIEIGLLPKVEEYHISWSNSANKTDLERAEIGVKLATAINLYLNTQGADLLVSAEQFKKIILNMELNKTQDNFEDLDLLREQLQEDLDLKNKKRQDEKEGIDIDEEKEYNGREHSDGMSG